MKQSLALLAVFVLFQTEVKPHGIPACASPKPRPTVAIRPRLEPIRRVSA